MGKVRYGQHGYDGQSMSNRARIAYAEGEMPKSKWTKAAMLDAIRCYCEQFGIAYDRTRMRFTKCEIFERFFEWKSWHHTGKYANETDFYGIDEDAVINYFEKR